MFKPTSAYFPALTGIRAIAAYLVFVHHYCDEPEKVDYGVFSIDSILSELHIGVSFFFVLSGFLIHNRYYDIFKNGLSGIKKYIFYRFARIYPVFFLINFVFFATYVLFNEVNSFRWAILFFINVTLLKGFIDLTKFSGIGQAWSLTVEFSFYLLAPVFFYLFKDKVRSYVFACLVLLCLCFVVPKILLFLPYGALLGTKYFFLSYTFLGRSFEFLAGCYLSMKISIWQKSKTSFPFFTSGGLVGCFLCLLAIALFRNGKVAGILHPGGITINNFILPGFIVLFFRGIIIENSIVSTFLSNRYMQVLGKASYTFYLLHIGFIESVFDFLRIENLLMVFVLINLISYLIYRFFEEPSQKWLVNWYNKKVSS